MTAWRKEEKNAPRIRQKKREGEDARTAVTTRGRGSVDLPQRRCLGHY